jgi:hypothetical protein
MACTRSEDGAAGTPATVAVTTTRPVAPVATSPAVSATTARVPVPVPPTGCGSATCPTEALPGFEVAGVPAGWIRSVDLFDPTVYRIRYTAPAPASDPLAVREAEGRRISLVVMPDRPKGPVIGGYPGHPASVAGVPATVVEVEPPPGGRHGVEWRAGGLVFEVYAFMDEPELLALAATVRATGRPAQR